VSSGPICLLHGLDQNTYLTILFSGDYSLQNIFVRRFILTRQSSDRLRAGREARWVFFARFIRQISKLLSANY